MNAISANLNETAPAKATGGGGFIMTTGANTVIQRDAASNTINASTPVTSTSYVALTGPDLTGVVSGTRVILWMTAQMNNSVAGVESIMSFAISGAGTAAADDDVSVANQSATALTDVTVSRCVRLTVTAGSNTYSPRYRVGAASTGNFRRRSLVAIPQ
jgi:hypothetical protein